eukprot:c17207_g1_i2.p2 GENE.c17207_g1_i2~~c17207_g1_i2.p2  ORF type:complete len:240 (-),score=41.66 c17207_g1_i2:1227-1919(-)
MSRSMVLALLMLSCCLLIASGPAMGQTVPVCTDPTKFNQTLETSLLSSTDMVPHIVALQAAVPINVLWTFLSTGDLASWNPLFNQVQTASLSLCGALSASYSNGAFLADVLPDVQISAPHWIVQFGCDAAGDTCALGYFFTATIVSSQELVVFGRHTWELYNNGDGTTTVSSFEKVAGPAVLAYVSDWNASMQESIVDTVTGILCLERLYLATGSLSPQSVTNQCTHFSP